MKRTSLLAVIFASSSILGLADPLPEPVPSISIVTPTSFNLDWDGTLGNTYFIQYSTDLFSWDYMPVIKSGTGIPLGYGFSASGDRLFLRLNYTDIPTNDPLTSDFDDDGISNWDEVKTGGTGTDPLLYQDLDANGIADDWEVYWDDQFSVFPKTLKAELTYRESTIKNIYLSNPVSPDANFTVTVQNNIAPNQVGYTSTDSVTGAAVYAWTDISTTGTLLSTISNTDDDVEEITLLQLTIPFYGTAYNKVFVSSNGLITFGSGDDEHINKPIPTTSTPNLFIAPFWDDLKTSTSGDIYYKEESAKLIIQFENVARYSGVGTYTFQAVLHSDGEIEFFYKDMTGALDSATVGVENLDGSDGLAIPHDSATYIQNLMAVKLSYGPLKFVEVSPLLGTTTIGNISPLNTRFNAWNLPPGTYTANIQVTHTGTGITPWGIPAVLEVTNPPTNIELTSPEEGSVFWSHDTFYFRATATDDDFGIEQVEFFTGETKRGEDITPSYSYLWSPLIAGNHVLTARAVDHLGTVTISDPIQIEVLLDIDEDLMEDNWELANGLNPTVNDANEDLDDDDANNRYEYDQHTLANDDTNTPANEPAVINITEPSEGEKVLQGDNLVIRATATDGDTNVDAVEFYYEASDGNGGWSNKTLLNTDWSSSWYYSWNTSPVLGQIRITAIAIDDYGHDSDPSSPVIVTVLADADGDKMWDDWEILHFGNLDESASTDFDTDGYTNLEEYQLELNPKVVEDTDGDGMPDGWEFHNGFDLQNDDSQLDPDNDGLSNLQEFNAKTSPIVTDTDDDGANDGDEIQYGTNPLIHDDWLGRDSDNDGLNDLIELLLGLNPFDDDTNDNGMLDGPELHAGGSPGNPNAPLPAPLPDPLPPGSTPDPDPTIPPPSAITPGDYEILIDSVNIAFPKHGHAAFQTLDPPRIYLTKTISQSYAGSNGEVESGPNGINGSSTVSIDKITGQVTTEGDNFVSSFGDIVSMVMKRGTKEQSGYDDPPNQNGDGTATIVGLTLLSSENTTDMLLINAAAELDDYEDTFQSGTPYAYRNLHANELQHDYQKVQFKFKWKEEVTSEQRYGITYFVIFQPEDDPDTTEIDESVENAEVVATIEWDGQGAQSEVFEIDPDTKKPGKDGKYSLLPVDLITDINNDGGINSADNVLRDASLKDNASDEDVEKGTEYHFVNDDISNGLWDVEDTGAVSFTYAGPGLNGYGTMPVPPSSHTNDDDVEEIHVKLGGLRSGVVWFTHGSISEMEFFTSRECKPSDSLGSLSGLNPFDLTSGVFPETLYIKVGTGGSSVTKETGKYLEMYVGKTVDDVWGSVEIRWTVVKKFGAEHYFHAARDYIMENNTLMCVKEHGYPLLSNSPDIVFRLCIMREEATSFAAKWTTAKGIKVFAAGSAIADPAVVINGNQNFWSYGWDESSIVDLGLMSENVADKCHGRIIAGGFTEAISSDNYDTSTTPAAGSPLAGPDPIPGTTSPGGKYVGWVPNPHPNPQGLGTWTFGAGQATGWRATGGLSTFYASPLRVDKAHQMVGYANGIEAGEGSVFTATQIKGEGAASAFAAEAKLSGVPPLVPSADPNAIKLFILDSGAGSLGLIHKDPSNALQDAYIGRKSEWGIPYYVNNYLEFYPSKSRP